MENTTKKEMQMTGQTQEKIRKTVAKVERYCDHEKAVEIVAVNSRYSISEVREAAKS